MSNKLHLPTVTLCCVDTRMTAQAVHALRQCMRQVEFAEVLLLGRNNDPSVDLSGITLRQIPELRSIDDYSRFMVHGLREHISTDHVLVVQWDGFIVDASRWQDDFLQQDYIGPPWYHGNTPGKVGNGGFSLRSRRLLDALAGFAYDGKQPEDMAICVTWRHELEARHGIRFAPVPMATAFGVEYGGYRPCFGFHGMHNFAHVMNGSALADWLAGAPRTLLTAQHTRKLIKELMRCGRGQDALNLIRQRSAVSGWNKDLLNLYLRALVHRARQRLRGQPSAGVAP